MYCEETYQEIQRTFTTILHNIFHLLNGTFVVYSYIILILLKLKMYTELVEWLALLVPASMLRWEELWASSSLNARRSKNGPLVAVSPLSQELIPFNKSHRLLLHTYEGIVRTPTLPITFKMELEQFLFLVAEKLSMNDFLPMRNICFN